MFCVSVSRLDSLGLILKNLDSTKLKLLPAVMCSSANTMWGRILSAFWERSGTAAEEHSLPYKMPQCHWMSQVSLLTQQCLSWAPSSKPLCWTSEKQVDDSPTRNIPSHSHYECLRRSAELSSLRDPRGFLAEIWGSHKQRCTHHHADFASISHRTHPSTRDKT